MQVYLTYSEYQSLSGTLIPQEKFDDISKKVSRKIDGLTFNRIVGGGFDNLTDFQKNIVKEAMVTMCDFDYDNDDFLQSPISSYSINGVSATYDLKTSAGAVKINGIITSSEGYDILKQSGLTCLKM